MVNNGYTRDLAIDAVGSGYADLVAFGRPTSPTPTWSSACAPARRSTRSTRSTSTAATREGYTDYPALATAASR